MTKTQRIIVSIFAIALIGIPLALWGITSFINRTNGENAIITDRDTGEVYDTNADYPQTGGAGVETSNVVLFGFEPFVEELYRQDKSTAYINAVKTALWNYSESRLDNAFKTITLRPQGLVITDKEVRGTIRLGQTDTILPILITPTKDSNHALITINMSGTQYKGPFVYVSGMNNSENLLFTITQKDTYTSDLEIKTFEGYREVALKYIEDTGYHVPDFVINFSNYENPFK